MVCKGNQKENLKFWGGLLKGDTPKFLFQQPANTMNKYISRQLPVAALARQSLSAAFKRLPVAILRLRLTYLRHKLYGHVQNAVPPVNIPIPTEIDYNGWCTYPKMVPLVLTHSHIDTSDPTQKRAHPTSNSAPYARPVVPINAVTKQPVPFWQVMSATGLHLLPALQFRFLRLC